jgi:plasmid stabilization system protein ParE
MVLPPPTSRERAKTGRKLMLAGDELMHHPYLGRVARPGELRELIVCSYVSVYRIVDDLVDIVTLIHGARRRKPRSA